MEIMILINPLLQILASIWYCHFLVRKLPKGFPRLISLLPILYLFSIVPWLFSSSVALRALSSFFLTWISSFKLLSFAFARGPLSATSPPLSALDFALLALLPLRVKDKSTRNILVRYEVVRFLDRPHLATSLREFWGSRWNKMSSHVLRVAIYDPTREFLERWGRSGIGATQWPLGWLSRPWSARTGAMAVTLVVSGVMHEVVFYYITCGARPTWEVTWFFVLHGVCMVAEGLVGWKPVQPVVARVVTVGFVLVTFYWLLVLPVWTGGGGDCNFTTKT